MPNIYLQTMKVKLQPPSATELPAYNPILPPSAITQVMLLANPQNVSLSTCQIQYQLLFHCVNYQWRCLSTFFIIESFFHKFSSWITQVTALLWIILKYSSFLLNKLPQCSLFDYISDQKSKIKMFMQNLHIFLD